MRSGPLRDTASWALIALPVISGLWLAIGVGVLAALSPGYSHVSHFMSVLGAAGAPYAAWTNYAVFIPTELWFLGFLALLNARLPDRRLTRVSLILLATYAGLLMLAAGLPCDAGCNGGDDGQSAVHIAHMIAAAVAYPLALIGLFLLVLTLPQPSLLRRFALPSLAVGGGLFGAIIAVPEAQGLFQRLLEAWIYAQFIALGVHAALCLRPQ
ncbi:DUF998 domain-containing protein [Phaeobacter sp. LSS9]|uniref:DUF998 domain-containing protein n=1 Tax=unclassified Phaeobacter TaxID=2621772 RepID=UPI000E4E3105|nr:DUF998 domain-containing protein [Phaeobacter sp. LSS9]AXT33708.1 DUF998 domain-containing protein [Phaeobacter sp. LSS9]